MPEADFRVLYVDEATFYRQPTVAHAWWLTGKESPVAPLSHRFNTKTRIAGALDVKDGSVYHQISARCGVVELTRFWKSLEKRYPGSEKIYLVMDNWPVYFHERIWNKLNQSGAYAEGQETSRDRIEVVPLPTYSPWLNPIEKVWRYLKQKVIHMHHMADDIHGLRYKISSILDEFESGSQKILRYTGLCIK